MISRVCAPYGLACAIDFDWPSSPAAPSGRAAELHIALGELGRYAELGEDDYQLHALRPASDPAAPPTVRVDRARDGHYRVRYADGAEFVIDQVRSEIYGISRSDLTNEDLLVYLQGPIMGFALRLRGRTCLHASAVEVEGRAVVFMGEGGMGKSTTAAALALRGVPVLADDVVALRDDPELHVEPGLSRLLLWPESVAALLGDAEAMPRIVSTWDKRYLDLTGPGLRMASAAPLGAIFVLKERAPELQAPELAPLTGANALIELVANTYANDFLDRPLRANELLSVGRIAREVPMRSVRMPDDRASLGASCEALLEHARLLLRPRHLGAV